MCNRLLILLVSIFLVTTQGLAQTQVYKLKQVHHPEIEYSHALCIHQDEAGMHWVGTYAGLKKVTPYEVKHFHPAPGKANLPNPTIHCIEATNSSNIWLGTGNGLVLFDPIKADLVSTYGQDDSTALQIKDVLDTKSDTVWVGTSDGLWIYQRSTDQFAPLDLPKLKGVLVNGLIIYRGKLWIGTEKLGAFTLELTGANLKHQLASGTRQIRNEPVLTINGFLIHNDRLLAATWQDGMLIYMDHHNVLLPINIEPLKTMNVRAMLAKNHDEIWIASMYSGLQLVNLKTLTLDRIPLNTESAWSLNTDRKGNLWVGTMGKGVSIFDHAAHTFPHFKPALGEFGAKGPNDINCLATDENGVWMGTLGKGIYYWNKSDHTTKGYLMDQGRRSHIKRVFQDKNGTNWTGTEDGILYYNRASDEFKVVNHVKNGNSFSMMDREISFNDIQQDQEGRLWLSTYDRGLYYIDLNGPNKPMLQHADPLINGALDGELNLTLHIDPSDRIWLIRENSINLIKPNGEVEKLPKYGAHSITHDPQGNIWLLAYGDDGLFRFNEQTRTFDAYHLNPLLGGGITGLQHDANGNQWVYSYNGIIRVDAAAEDITRFTTKDGLQSDFIHHNANAVTPEGLFVIGGENGINIFDPQHVELQNHQPAFGLTAISVLNQAMALDSIPTENGNTFLTLPYDQNVVTFEFGVVDYTAADQYLFSYEMHGFDQNVRTTAKGQRQATYTNLDPGTYQLKYWLQVPGQDEPAEIKMLQVKILPPFWMTWWFKLLCGVSILLILLVAYKIRMNMATKAFHLQQMAQEKELVQLRNEKLRNDLQRRSDELNASTMSVIKRNNSIDKITAGITELMDKMKDDHDRGRVKHFLSRMDEYKQDEMTWDEFVKDFDASHNDFITRFKTAFPEVQQKELKLCAYLRMGLSNPEIASLMGVSIRSVETMRYRIRKKIGDQIQQTLSEFVLGF